MLRYVLTGSLDHAHRLLNLISSPTCPHCHKHDETAEYIFWYCFRWKHVRASYSTLLRLFSLVGTQWPNCFLHCGWVEHDLQYGIPLLHNVGLFYIVNSLAHDTHHMFLQILLARHTATGATIHPPHSTSPISQPSFTPYYLILTLLMCTVARRRLTNFFDV